MRRLKLKPKLLICCLLVTLFLASVVKGGAFVQNSNEEYDK